MESLITYSDSEEDSAAKNASFSSETGKGFSLVYYNTEEQRENGDRSDESPEKEATEGGIVIIHHSSSTPIRSTPSSEKESLTPVQSPSIQFSSSIPSINEPLSSPANVVPLLSLPSLEEILPPKPDLSLCSPHLKAKLQKFFALKKQGKSVNRNLRESHAFKNPDILEKLISFCSIVEIGSNYPREVYDPFGFENSGDFYDELAKEQQLMYERREQERQTRAQLEFVKANNVTSTASQASSLSSIGVSGVSNGTESVVETTNGTRISSKPIPVQHIVIDSNTTSSSKITGSINGKRKSKTSKWDQKTPSSGNVLSNLLTQQPERQQPEQQQQQQQKPEQQQLQSLPIETQYSSFKASADAYANYIKEKKREAEQTKETEKKKKKI